MVTSVTIIVPTLNEAENIGPLFERISRVRHNAGLDFDVLVVDSASSDATCKKVADWQDREQVQLLCREKDVGLAGAVILGAKAVDSDVVLVMDADLSHPPEAIPQLLQPLLDDTHDMVIGSRYVSGGATPDWPLSRKLSSRLATVPALMFCEVKDPLAGFFAVRRELLTGLSGNVPGFKIGLAILAEYGPDLRVREIPISFRDRNHGESKMNRGVVLDYLRQLRSLFLGKVKQKMSLVRQ